MKPVKLYPYASKIKVIGDMANKIIISNEYYLVY